jgi:hypothetical protein
MSLSVESIFVNVTQPSAGKLRKTITLNVLPEAYTVRQLKQDVERAFSKSCTYRFRLQPTHLLTSSWSSQPTIDDNSPDVPVGKQMLQFRQKIMDDTKTLRESKVVAGESGNELSLTVYDVTISPDVDLPFVGKHISSRVSLELTSSTHFFNLSRFTFHCIS